MREDKAFDPSCTGRQRVADHRRRDVLERAIALLQPPSEEAMETWPLKRLRRAPETFVGGPDARVWHRPQLPEVPRQFLNRTGVQRAFQFVVDDGLEPWVGVGDRTGKHQSQCPGGKRSKEVGVTAEERPKVMPT